MISAYDPLTNEKYTQCTPEEIKEAFEYFASILKDEK